MENRYGKTESAKRIYATTDKSKGALKTLADAEGYETFVVPDDIGGRFSVLTAVGLLPIAVSGADIEKLMQGASQGEIASAMGVAPFIARKYMESAQGFSAEALKWMVRRVAEIDLEIKEGRVSDWSALEQYVMECVYNHLSGNQ